MNPGPADALRRPWRRLVALSATVNLLLLVPALFSLQVFDRVLSSHSVDTLLLLLLGVGLVFALLAGADYLRTRLQGTLAMAVHDAVLPEVFLHALDRTSRRQGPMELETLRDAARVRNLLQAPALIGLVDLPWALVYLGVITLAHVALGALALGCIVVMVFLAWAMERHARSQGLALQTQASQLQHVIESALQGAEVAQAMGMGRSVLARWSSQAARLAAEQAQVAGRAVALAVATRTFRQAAQVLIMALGAYLVIAGQATPGVLIAASMLLGRALAPVEAMVGGWRTLLEGREAYRRLTPLLAQIRRQSAAPPMPLPAPQGRLQAAGLVMRAPQSDRLLVAGVSLTLQPGESLAILGHSGAGKSTLLRMLGGLWPPTSGVARLDGVDLANWPRDQLGPHIGYVPQDVELFAGTVAENIARLGPVEADLVVAAAQEAGIHDLVLGLPNGYDTWIDANAALLSPGQRQRIALARALYGRPKLLLLDEPNANLDGAAELALGETLRRLQGQATVVLVTHRTALTQHVDQLLVLDAGRPLHQGPTREVLQALQAGASHGAQVVPMARPPSTQSSNPGSRA